MDTFVLDLFILCLKVKVYQFILSRRTGNEWKNNTKVFSIDSKKVTMKKRSIALFVVNTKNLKTLKYYKFLKRKLVLFIICSRCGSKDEEIFKEEVSIKNIENSWLNQ